MSSGDRLVECVPNFSEGRDRATLRALEHAVASAAGVALLDSTMDPDHNRLVLTFAGPPHVVADAALAAATVAVDRIDLRTHRGVHPRIGALDVLPFVPLKGTSLEECAKLAAEVGSRIWECLRVPVYFYEAAARRAEFRDLARVRKAALQAAPAAPDIGGPESHPTAGAVAVGARGFLIAFNVILDTGDLEPAKRIARAVRASSGGLPGVKALGLMLESRGAAQVSMNLTDFEKTPIHEVYEAVRGEAEAAEVRVLGTEFVGLVPRRAYEASAGRVPGLEESMVLEQRLQVR